MADQGGPWGLLGDVARKDGVQGVLLLLLCALVFWGQREAREDRIAFQLALEKANGIVVTAHGKTIEVAANCTEAIRANTVALADNTRVMQRVEYRLNGRRSGG